MGSIPTKFQAERCHSRIICLQAYPIEYTDVFCFVIGAHQCQVSLLARHSGQNTAEGLHGFIHLHVPNICTHTQTFYCLMNVKCGNHMRIVLCLINWGGTACFKVLYLHLIERLLEAMWFTVSDEV